MEQSLKFLYHRIKKTNITKEQAESKVCQEILISKIGNDSFLVSKVAFKGGLIIDSLSRNRRGYTKDIDFDLIKYPLSYDALCDFFSRLSKCQPYQNIIISIDSISELRHKGYQGKRLELLFSDKESIYKLKVDIGVYLPLVRKNKTYEYEVAFGYKSKIFINPIERMITEKISTFIKFGKDNTRDKDFYDLYFLLSSFKYDEKIVNKMLETLLIKKEKYITSFSAALSKMETLLFDKKYYAFLEKSERNWMAIEPSVARNEILSQLRRIVEAK